MINFISYLLILHGIGFLIGIWIVNAGFYTFLRFWFPIAMSLAPLHKTWQVWMELPLPLYIQVALTNASVADQIRHSTLGTGHVTIDIHMDPWTGGNKNVWPLIWIEEEALIDTIQRYLIGFSDGPLNYAKYFCWMIGLGALVPTVIGAILLLIEMRKKSQAEVGVVVNKIPGSATPSFATQSFATSATPTPSS